MIQATELTARTARPPRVELGPVSFALEKGGSYALVGAPTDGVELLLAVLAGSIAPRKGSIAVLGSAPTAGRTVAYAPYTPDLPAVLDVDDFLRLSSRIRGEPEGSPEERLAVLGVAPLARRRVGSLTFEESRTVALVEALTCRADLLLLADPLVELDPRATTHVSVALAARAEAGATVVLTTASREDAQSLCRDWLLFEKGKLALRTTDDDEWMPVPGAAGARLFIRSEGARYLLAELAGDPTFQTVRAEGAELVVTGRDPVVMATAVAMAARRANAELDVLRFDPIDPGARER
jgi:ABC-type multidrug transport system ATPase subunit